MNVKRRRQQRNGNLFAAEQEAAQSLQKGVHDYEPSEDDDADCGFQGVSFVIVVGAAGVSPCEVLR